MTGIAWRDSRVLPILLLALSASLTVSAQRPPAGRDVDERRTVALRAPVAGDCVAVRAAGAIVLLDRVALARLATAGPATWTTEAERVARIDGRRAQALLDRAGASSVRVRGCAALDAPALRDELHLVADRQEAGDATVVVAADAQPDLRLVVRYVGRRAGPAAGGGEIQFLREGATTPFLRVEWWRA